MLALDNNKKKYDKQLYSDWIAKVYDICSSVCVRQDGNSVSELREAEKVCGRACIRKYDAIYKMYDKLEGKILNLYCED